MATPQENFYIKGGLGINFTYDALDRRILTTLPDKAEIQYEYDAWNLKSVTYGAVRHEYNSYDSIGNLLQSTLPHQLGTLDFTYDLNQRRRSITHHSFQHNIPENGFDKVGNLISDQFQDLLGSTIRNYTYDDLYQLTSEKGDEDHAYAYDSLNNRITKDNAPNVINSLNQLIEQDHINYTYDLNGNRLSKNEHGNLTLYFYDALNRMTSVITHDQHIQYVYDPFDRRLSKKEDQYLYDGQNEIGMFRDEKPQELRILKSHESSEHGCALAIQLADEVFIPIHDLFGNVAMLISKSGEPSQIYRYSAFGKELNTKITDPNPWRYASKRLDPETGFVYFGRRYYDPEIASWISPDPAEFVDGANFHAYLHNNPLYRFDAYGLWGESFLEGGFSYGSGICNRAYEMGEGFFGLAESIGRHQHAHVECEYGNLHAFDDLNQNAEGSLEALSKAFNESPCDTIGNILAPGCMKAYNLNSDATLSERM